MKQSPLYDCLPPEKIPGEYAGWRTALSFGDPERELRTAIEGIAATDHSMYGRIEVTGGDRLDLLHRLSTNSLSGLPAGGVATTVFVTDKGRIIDRVIVCPREDSLLLITSPGAEPFLIRWIEKYTITEDITLRSVTDETAMVSLIGYHTVSMVSAATDFHIDENASIRLQHRGTDLFAVRTTDSRADLMRVISPRDRAGDLTEIAGSLPGARWIGLAAYEGFRIARGIPANPEEINERYNPLEAGLRDTVSFTKGCYIGQEVIARLDTYGKTKRYLSRIDSPEPLPGPLPRSLLKTGVEAGTLTSMAEIPLDGRFPGIAILRNDIASPGEMLAVSGCEVSVVVRDTSSGR